MFGNYFYNESMRRMTIGFGQIFNNIQIKRRDSAGNITQSIKVPLAYAPKEKFLARLDAQQDLNGDDSKVAITLPRMSFEVTGYSYDGGRKLNKNQKITKVTTNADTTKMNSQYMPVPYNVNFSLSVYVANSDDGLQIIEQILPYFQPDYTVTMIEDRTMDTKRDIPFILNNVDFEDSYTGSLTTSRRIIYTLTFTAKIYLFGPIATTPVIKTVSGDLYSDTASNTPRVERVTVTPNPSSSDKDDDYTYTTTLDFFADTLDYDEATGEDKTSSPTKPA